MEASYILIQRAKYEILEHSGECGKFAKQLGINSLAVAALGIMVATSNLDTPPTTAQEPTPPPLPPIMQPIEGGCVEIGDPVKLKPLDEFEFGEVSTHALGFMSDRKNSPKSLAPILKVWSRKWGANYGMRKDNLWQQFDCSESPQSFPREVALRAYGEENLVFETGPWNEMVALPGPPRVEEFGTCEVFGTFNHPRSFKLPTKRAYGLIFVRDGGKSRVTFAHRSDYPYTSDVTVHIRDPKNTEIVLLGNCSYTQALIHLFGSAQESQWVDNDEVFINESDIEKAYLPQLNVSP